MAHNVPLLFLILINAIVYGVATIFNAFAGSTGVKLGIFKSETGNISDKYYVEITPAGWMFSIWGVIYVWEAVWIVYTIVNLFRKTENGPLYCNPTLLPWSFFFFFIINMSLNLAWIFLFDREQMIIAFPVLFFIAFTLYVCMFISYRHLDKNIDFLRKDGRKVDIWCIRIMVQNGLGVYATWTTIATLINMAIVMIYKGNPRVANDDASTVALSILAVELLGYTFVDIVFLDRYTRYTVTPWFVVPIALGASLAKNYKAGSRNSILTIVMISLSVVCLVAKMFTLLWRELRSTTKSGLITESYDDLKKKKSNVV
ncbi:uncharacterized protein LOC133175793 [Saccostrea echinata]|uniref:uncharacterized protein LOC133175793 n=1 Tax=Saccostrea echinata TaxID=191078 RepID=UPI002A80275E|nr:uncharacterized protein LOC133175793 [Saccostrea echinata]